MKSALLAEYLTDQSIHSGSTVIREAPLTVSTPAAQWAYALSYRLRPEFLSRDGVVLQSLRVGFDIEVASGRIGVGWTSLDGGSFLIERLTARNCRVSFLLEAGQRVGRLVFRNTSDSGAASEFTVSHAHARPVPNAERRYPVSVAARDVPEESVPRQGGTLTVFDTYAALAINAARLAWLEQAGLPIVGSRVLDAGCGIGHFIPFYAGRACTVVAIDGRGENICELRRRHPHVEAHVADVQRLDPQQFGEFDVIHCLGLLYHLDSPVAALRNFHAMCRGLLIVETMVCDSAQPVSVLVDETKAASQALAGLGSRPSPAFLALALNRVGFDYVYGAAMPPEHPDFQFSWTDNLDTIRNGFPLRCMIVASRARLDLPTLTPLLES